VGPMRALYLAIDGGNSKTDVVVASTTGEVLARVRGPGVDTPLLGADAWRDALVHLVRDGLDAAGLPAGASAACAAYFLANVDLPVEQKIARAELGGAGLAETTLVHNDALAILRSGAPRPWGIAVVSGAGINAVGVHPSGKVAGFLALGDISGDIGGGHWVGVEGLRAAVRAQDRRGPATVLATTVPAFYGLRRPQDVSIRVHRGEIRHDDLNALAPLVIEAADAGDGAAVGIVAALGDEVATMAGALIRRLRLTRSDVDVVLGGGVLQAGHEPLVTRVEAGVRAVAPRSTIRVLDVPPVFGAVVEAFRHVGADESALARLREQLRLR